MFELRDYQKECVSAIETGWQQGARRLLVVMPTGAGKTVVFASLIAKYLQAGRFLVISHREEIIHQTVGKIRKCVPPTIQVGVMKAKRKEISAQILVASIQTLSKQQNLSLTPPADFYLIIVDEAHHVRAPSYMRVLEHFQVFEGNGPRVLGFTATPERSDKLALGKVFEDIAFYMDVDTLIEKGYLCDVKGVRVMAQIDTNQIPIIRGDFSEKELSTYLLRANAPNLVADALTKYAPERKSIVFTPGVEMAYAVTEELMARGIPAATIEAQTENALRKNLIEDFQKGKLQTLVNCAVFTEGFDEPSTNCIVIARPTRSRTLYVQMVGRGMRTYQGKENCLVIDLVGATEDHQLQTLDKLLCVDPADLHDVGFLKAKRAADDKRKVMVERLLARLVEMPAMLTKTKYRWLKSQNRFLLPLAQEEYYVFMQAGFWHAFHRRYGETERQICSSKDLANALAMCEKQIEENPFVRVLAQPNAIWRSKNATEAQLQVLREKWKLPVPDNISRGTASDLIAIGRIAATRLMERMPSLLG